MASITVTSDLARIDLDLVHRWLSTHAYWALGRSRETVERAAAGSLNFAAVDDSGAMLAYARVVTDRATFAWLCDVYVEPGARGAGVGSTLVRAVLDALEPMGLSRVMLATEDAHGVYARLGFEPVDRPDELMRLAPAEARAASPDEEARSASS